MITNTLSNGIEIEGSISFSENLLIDGKVKGDIISKNGSVTIGDSAKIEGNITAGEVKLHGHLRGKIKSNRCELRKTSNITGEIDTKNFSSEEGAAMNCSVKIG